MITFRATFVEAFDNDFWSARPVGTIRVIKADPNNSTTTEKPDVSTISPVCKCSYFYCMNTSRCTCMSLFKLRVKLTHLYCTNNTTLCIYIAQPPEDYDIYSECGETKGCFGSSTDCIDSKSCPMLSTYKQVNPYFYQIEIYGSVPQDSYLALGFSDDKKMV